MSRIGKKPVELPQGVTANVSGQTIEVKGPKGTRTFTATDDVTLKVENGAVLQRQRHVIGRGEAAAAFRALDLDGLALDLRGHALGEGDRFLTNPRHLCPP